MRWLHDQRDVDQPADVAGERFAGRIPSLLPVVAGHDEDTWRTQTLEGPVRVPLQVHAGDTWTLPDGTRRRTLTVEPDRSSFRYMIVAGLTPTVDGELRLEPAGSRCRLVFEGSTRRRSHVTTALERFLIGDPLAHSGVRTLLDVIAGRLSDAEPPAPPGPVRVAGMQPRGPA